MVVLKGGLSSGYKNRMTEKVKNAKEGTESSSFWVWISQKDRRNTGIVSVLFCLSSEQAFRWECHQQSSMRMSFSEISRLHLMRSRGLCADLKLVTLFSLARKEYFHISHLLVKIDGRVIGDGKVGPITRTLQNAYKKLTEDSGADSVWERIRIYKGKIFKLEEHLKRFKCIVLDGDGVITPNEERLHCIFEDILCKIFDMIKPETRVLSNHNMVFSFYWLFCIFFLIRNINLLNDSFRRRTASHFRI
ncbi:hypothetical protein ISN45_Aa05g011190 [Arabidopsis thaliana x Arabidopsis arenosa]|uniref:Uncharacterized protein n=1 Tax=Arabidopsis thaliana x Arabidopsis arenosa TaxID=1240361 RepID=A0A8T1ZJP1_9BRAS|nr:hypothetical protein ISN45_Aa05g011190 [Arabidopsis thaliana x Arabidopsis arenosa]